MSASPPDGGHALSPPLPYDMTPRADRATRDVKLQQFVHTATRARDHGRVHAFDEAFDEIPDSPDDD